MEWRQELAEVSKIMILLLGGRGSPGLWRIYPEKGRRRVLITMNAQTHWERIYTEKAPDAVSWYPRALQFAEDAPDMPENQNFYIIQHGIRLSGMPGWKGTLSEQETWQVTTFLSHMDKLPAQVSEAWKTAAIATKGASSSPDTTKPETRNEKSMSMPMN